MRIKILCLILAALFASSAHAQVDALSQIVDAADAAADDKNYADAIKRYRAALDLAKREGRKDRAVDITNDLIATHYASGDLKSALEMQKELLSRSLERDQPLVSADAAMKTAVLAVKLRLPREAERQLQYAEVIFTEAHLDASLGKVYFYKALVEQANRNYDKTVLNFQRSRELYRGVGQPIEAALRILDVANVYKEFLSRFEEALFLYDEATTELEAAGAHDLALDVRIDKGNTLVDVGQIENALDLLTETLGRISRAKAARSWIRASQMLAKAHYRAGNFRDVERHIGNILAALQLISDAKQRAAHEIDALNLRAMVAAELGRFDVAFKDFAAAISTATANDLKAKQAYLHNNVGYWMREQGRHADAAKSHEKALEIDRELASQEGVAYDLRNLGLAKLESGELEYAAELLTEALEISLTVGGAYNTAYTYLGLGELRLKQGDYPKAASQFLKAVELAEKNALRNFAWQAHAGFAQAAWQQNDAKAADEHFKRAVELIEKLASQLAEGEARQDFKASARVQKVYTSYEGLLRRIGRTADADALRLRAQPKAGAGVL